MIIKPFILCSRLRKKNLVCDKSPSCWGKCTVDKSIGFHFSRNNVHIISINVAVVVNKSAVLPKFRRSVL